MSLQTLIISVLVTCITVGATFFYFRNRIQRTEQKVDLMFSLIQEHENNNKLRQQYQPSTIQGGMSTGEQQGQFQQEQHEMQGNELINISDDDGDSDDDSDYDSDDSAEVTAPLSHSDTASASAEHTEGAAAASSNMGSSGVSALAELGVVAEPQTGVEPFLVVEINLSNNRSERLVCYEGETAAQAAARFCQQHAVSAKRRQRLEAILQTHLSTPLL